MTSLEGFPHPKPSGYQRPILGCACGAKSLGTFVQTPVSGPPCQNTVVVRIPHGCPKNNRIVVILLLRDLYMYYSPGCIKEHGFHPVLHNARARCLRDGVQLVRRSPGPAQRVVPQRPHPGRQHLAGFRGIGRGLGLRLWAECGQTPVRPIPANLFDEQRPGGRCDCHCPARRRLRLERRVEFERCGVC